MNVRDCKRHLYSELFGYLYASDWDELHIPEDGGSPSQEERWSRALNEVQAEVHRKAFGR